MARNNGKIDIAVLKTRQEALIQAFGDRVKGCGAKFDKIDDKLDCLEQKSVEIKTLLSNHMAHQETRHRNDIDERREKERKNLTLWGLIISGIAIASSVITALIVNLF